MDDLYAFAYRGVLTDENLDKAGRKRRRQFGSEDAEATRRALSYQMLDEDRLADAHKMSYVYVAMHAFENMVRDLVRRAMAEGHGESWWDKVPKRIRDKVEKRRKEDEQQRWHGTRGASSISYCDFGDLSAIISTNDNWPHFEDLLDRLEWAKEILRSLERSRNATMHGAVLEKDDIERIGMFIRDWIRQTQG